MHTAKVIKLKSTRWTLATWNWIKYISKTHLNGYLKSQNLTSENLQFRCRQSALEMKKSYTVDYYHCLVSHVRHIKHKFIVAHFIFWILFCRTSPTLCTFLWSVTSFDMSPHRHFFSCIWISFEPICSSISLLCAAPNKPDNWLCKRATFTLITISFNVRLNNLIPVHLQSNWNTKKY